MLVVVMDDQGGGMYINQATVSVSQGSYTSCSAEYVSCAGVWLGTEACFIPSVISPLTPAAPAAPALGLIGRRDVVMTMSLSLSPSLHHLTSCVRMKCWGAE